jgi:hypothetical protein
VAVIPFKRPERSDAKPQPSPKRTGSHGFFSELLEMTLGVAAEKGISVDPMIKLLRMRSHIGSLKGQKASAENIALRRQGLKSYELAELWAFAENSSESNWTEHPSYYLALIDEIRSRETETP